MFEQTFKNIDAPLRPAGTSPKSDELYYETAYKVFIVVFGGGRVGAKE